MDAKKAYGKMMDSAFGMYYARFRELNALSKETAVSGETLFPEGQTITDRDMMHKMLSMEVVKRTGMNRYWLDEKRASDPGAVLRQRVNMIVAAVALAVVYALLKKSGVI